MYSYKGNSDFVPSQMSEKLKKKMNLFYPMSIFLEEGLKSLLL